MIAHHSNQTSRIEEAGHQGNRVQYWCCSVTAIMEKYYRGLEAYLLLYADQFYSDEAIVLFKT